MVKIILKPCPVCFKTTEHEIEKLAHVSNETFEVKSRCLECTTPFDNFFQHRYLQNFERLVWGKTVTTVEVQDQ